MHPQKRRKTVDITCVHPTQSQRCFSTCHGQDKKCFTQVPSSFPYDTSTSSFSQISQLSDDSVLKPEEPSSTRHGQTSSSMQTALLPSSAGSSKTQSRSDSKSVWMSQAVTSMSQGTPSQLHMSKISLTQSNSSQPDQEEAKLVSESGYMEADLIYLKHVVETLTADTLQTVLRPIMFDHLSGAPETLHSARLARFTLASRYVKTVKVDPSYDELDQMLRSLTSLRYATRCMPLFPCLQTLVIKISRVEQLDYFDELLKPTVRSVRLSCGNPAASDVWSMRFGQVFRMLQSAWTTRLEEAADLSLYKLPMLQWTERALRQNKRFPSLASLQGDDTIFSPSLFRMITASPQLTELSAVILYFSLPRYDLLPEPLQCHCFQLLKKLVLNASLPNINALFHQLGASLEVLHLTTRCERINFADLHGFIPEDALWITQKLETFHFEIEETDRSVINYATYDKGMDDLFVRIKKDLPRPSAAPTTFPWRSFKPLMRCTGLTHFTFRFLSWNYLDLTDADMRGMSLAWPFLESFTIEWEKKSYRPGFPISGLCEESLLTLSCLNDLAENCHYLRTVKLGSLNGNKYVEIPELASPCKHPVEVYLGWARLRKLTEWESKELERSLRALWPKLRLKVHPNNVDLVAWNQVIQIPIELS